MAQVWDYVFGYVKISVVRCAVELEIPDLVEKHVGPISLSHLSSAVDCPPHAIHRVMRFLTYHGIFNKSNPPRGKHDADGDDDVISSTYYSQSPFSRLMTRDHLGPMMLLQGCIAGPVPCITVELLRAGKCPSYDHDYFDDDPVSVTRTFIDAMACHSRMTMSALIDNYCEGFKGVGVVVDVGGSNGMTLAMLIKAFPWLRGICFDLPKVVAKASPIDGIEFVGGSMFESVPKGDAVTLVWVLHNWGDKECVEILKKCKEAVPAGKGKVVIVDAVVEDDDEEKDELAGARLALDMTMMSVFPDGKERTYKEWTRILNHAGFRTHTVNNIKAIESVIEAYP